MITRTLWTDKASGSHLDITQHDDGTLELGLTHADDVGIDDGDHDGYSLSKMTVEDLIGVAAAILDVVVAGGVTK